jgi:hypothetical protein
MTRSSVTDAERRIAADMLDTIKLIIAGRVPDCGMKAHTRLVKAMKLPNVSRNAGICYDPRFGYRLSASEAIILYEWLIAVWEIFPSDDDRNTHITRAAEKFRTSQVWIAAFDKAHEFDRRGAFEGTKEWHAH